MGAYLFTGLVTQVLPEEEARRRGLFNPVVRGYHDGIVLGNKVEEAQTIFVGAYMKYNQEDPPIPTQVEEVVYAPLVDALITEAGFETIDWAILTTQMSDSIPSEPEEDFERGLWVSVNETVRPDGLGADINTLQQSLPEDISTGLNWDANRQFYFLVRAVSPLPPPSENSLEDSETPEPTEESDEESAETAEQLFVFIRDDGSMCSMRSDVAALIKARNSVVAAWLWRRYAADTPQAVNEIRLEAGFGAIGFPPAE